MSGLARPERLESPDPGEMRAGQRELYDVFACGPRADPRNAFPLIDADGRLIGPGATWLLSPRIGIALERLGADLEREASLSRRQREIAVLAVAGRAASDFELYAHRLAGRRCGLTDQQMDAIVAGADPAELATDEQLVLWTTRRLLESHGLHEDEYQLAVAGLGAPLVFELVTLVGYFELVALQLSVFGVSAPVATD
jgi:alkylhydroperoxidase family enzyme